MVTATNLTADRSAIRRDLVYTTRRWHELGRPALLEIRAFKEDRTPQINKYSPEWIDDAVEFAASMNALGFNIYAVRNPIKADCKGSASDDDILAAFFLWADCDDEGAAGNVKRFDGPKWTASVVTGKTPSTRVHVYWELEDPCLNLTAWRQLQADIATHFKSDRTVINPSRIMRVGGTVSWPASRKREKGYIDELTQVFTEYPGGREPVSFEQMRRVFTASAPAENAGYQWLDTGSQFAPPLDRERMAIQAMSGQGWHDAVVRLVGSYVSRGLTDAEIHALTDPLTTAGYTVEQTRAEVQAAIDGARRKGWTPEAKPREITPEERQAIKDTAPDLMFKPWGWRDLEAIPAPEFVYSDFYARGYTSLTVAPPKAGKSMLGLAEALDMATGRGILTGVQRDPLRVLYYNAEDDQNVVDARVSALLTHYSIPQSEIAETLYPVSGVDAVGFYMVTGLEGEVNEKLFAALEKFIEDQRIDVLIFDPLQDLSRSPETNEVFRILGQTLRRMANRYRVAIGLVHHTRKIAPGQDPTIDDARGGSALRGTARFNRLLVPMTEDEGAKAGVPDHRYFVRIGDAESNLAPPSSELNKWFQKVSVKTPNGHHVGALERWKYPDAFEGVTVDDACAVQAWLRQHEDDPPRLNVQSSTWVGHAIARVLEWDSDDKRVRAKLSLMVKKWTETGVLEVIEIDDTRNGRKAKAVIAGKNNPASVVEVKA